MEQDPTPHLHDECPNCGFELDLLPPVGEQTAKDLGSMAVEGGRAMTLTPADAAPAATSRKRYKPILELGGHTLDPNFAAQLNDMFDAAPTPEGRRRLIKFAREAARREKSAEFLPFVVSAAVSAELEGLQDASDMARRINSAVELRSGG